MHAGQDQPAALAARRRAVAAAAAGPRPDEAISSAHAEVDEPEPGDVDGHRDPEPGLSVTSEPGQEEHERQADACRHGDAGAGPPTPACGSLTELGRVARTAAAAAATTTP